MHSVAGGEFGGAEDEEDAAVAERYLVPFQIDHQLAQHRQQGLPKGVVPAGAAQAAGGVPLRALADRFDLVRRRGQVHHRVPVPTSRRRVQRHRVQLQLLLVPRFPTFLLLLPQCRALLVVADGRCSRRSLPAVLRVRSRRRARSRGDFVGLVAVLRLLVDQTTALRYRYGGGEALTIRRGRAVWHEERDFFCDSLCNPLGSTFRSGACHWSVKGCTVARLAGFTFINRLSVSVYLCTEELVLSPG